MDYVGTDAFSADAFGIKLKFMRDGEGKVGTLHFTQGGNDVKAKRE